MPPPPLPNSAAAAQRVVWWALWAAFQIGTIIIYIFMSQPAPAHPSPDETLWQLAFIPVAISAAIRWAVLPQIKNVGLGLPCFIVGVALAEASCFIGIFIFPAHSFPLFIASALGIFQFIPVYFGQFLGEPRP